MKLPHLDLLIPLERGQAQILARALAVLVQDTIKSTPLEAMDALTLTPLARLGQRVAQRHQQEQLRPPKAGKRAPARLLRVRYDELAAVHLNRYVLLHVGLDEFDQVQLQEVLGRFHQKSLNLERFVKLA